MTAFVKQRHSRLCCDVSHPFAGRVSCFLPDLHGTCGVLIRVRGSASVHQLNQSLRVVIVIIHVKSNGIRLLNDLILDVLGFSDPIGNVRIAGRTFSLNAGVEETTKSS